MAWSRKCKNRCSGGWHYTEYHEYEERFFGFPCISVNIFFFGLRITTRIYKSCIKYLLTSACLAPSNSLLVQSLI